MAAETRQLKDLRSVGPATCQDFADLGVTSVEQLAEEDATELYERLCAIKGMRVDRCCWDVFACAIAQARDVDLAVEKRDWWWWSGRRNGTC